MKAEPELTSGEYRDLAEFRRRIRQFLHFSESTAKGHGLEPQQHRHTIDAAGHV